MKFKTIVAVILSAILITNIALALVVISEEKKQTAIQKANTEISYLHAWGIRQYITSLGAGRTPGEWMPLFWEPMDKVEVVWESIKDIK